MKQISLPQKIYELYTFFEKSQNDSIENPFEFYKEIMGLNVKIAKNVSDLNLFQIDINVSKKINPNYYIKYLKDINNRNAFSPDSIHFNIFKSMNDNEWIEDEIYNGNKNRLVCVSSSFMILFYNENWESKNNLSNKKYYNSFKLLDNKDDYTIRFEMALNHLDIDFDVDISIYLTMIKNIIKAIYKRFNINS